MSNELRVFKESANLLAWSKSSVDYNSENREGLSPQEISAVVFNSIVKNSENYIFMYEDKLSGDLESIDPELRISIDNFLREGKKMVVVVDIKPIESDFEAFMERTRILSSDLRIFKASEQFKSALKEKLNGNFFMLVADDSLYRLEKQEDDRTWTATWSFNNRQEALRLKGAFNFAFTKLDRNSIIIPELG